MMLKKKEQISRLGANSNRRNIIADYGDFGSQVFAPLTKLGLFPDRCQKKYRVKSHFLSSYRGTTLTRPLLLSSWYCVRLLLPLALRPVSTTAALR